MWQQRWQHNEEQRVFAGSCKSRSRFGTKKGQDWFLLLRWRLIYNSLSRWTTYASTYIIFRFFTFLEEESVQNVFFSIILCPDGRPGDGRGEKLGVAQRGNPRHASVDDTGTWWKHYYKKIPLFKFYWFFFQEKLIHQPAAREAKRWQKQGAQNSRRKKNMMMVAIITCVPKKYHVNIDQVKAFCVEWQKLPRGSAC